MENGAWHLHLTTELRYILRAESTRERERPKAARVHEWLRRELHEDDVTRESAKVVLEKQLHVQGRKVDNFLFIPEL